MADQNSVISQKKNSTSEYSELCSPHINKFNPICYTTKIEQWICNE